jgi:hypothetical protein
MTQMENGYQNKIMQWNLVTVQMLAQPIRAQGLRHQSCIIKVCEIKTVDIGRASGFDRQKTLSGTKFLNLLSLQILLLGEKEDRARS